MSIFNPPTGLLVFFCHTKIMSQEKELVFSSSLKLMQNSIRIPDAVYITGVARSN
jgi:hypothetical protein